MVLFCGIYHWTIHWSARPKLEVAGGSTICLSLCYGILSIMEMWLDWHPAVERSMETSRTLGLLSLVRPWQKAGPWSILSLPQTEPAAECCPLWLLWSGGLHLCINTGWPGGTLQSVMTNNVTKIVSCYILLSIFLLAVESRQQRLLSMHK